MTAKKNEDDEASFLESTKKVFTDFFFRNGSIHCCLGAGFKYFCMFTPKIGEDSHFDSCFSMVLKPPTSCVQALTSLNQSR